MKKVYLGLFVLVGFGLIYYFFIFNHVSVTLKGNSIKHSVYKDYQDSGVIVKNYNKEVDKGNYEVKVESDVDKDKIGTYNIKYIVKYNGKEYELNRTVDVVDDEKPVIEANLEEITRDYCTKKDKTKLTYTANDNYDGDLTDKISVEENDDKIILSVSDSSGNTFIKELKIKYTEKPSNKLVLVGNNKVFVPLNGTYNESGANYTDGCGNKIDKKVTISGSVDTTTKGSYTLTYKVDGEKELTRVVTVYEPSEKKDGKVIYLTFDDGPHAYTKSILNTLKKYNVKATFFVTHQFPSYEYLIKEEAKEGHAIAAHTYTHNYSKVYASVDAYLNDFNKMNEVIKNQTGSYVNLFRFPGGSSNTVSKKGLVREIAKRMTDDGYVYFDWNVSSGDASGASSTKIYNNVIKGVNNCTKCVVLMHDIKSTTRDALDPILKTLTEKGYSFSTLDASSYTAHHGFSS